MQDAPPIDISVGEWKNLLGVLQARIPDRNVWAFGSRAKWKAKEFSDLDLAIEGEKPIPLSVLSKLSDDFDELEFRFRVDVVDLPTVSPEFRKRIEQDRVLVQRASKLNFVRLGSVCSKIGSGATPRGGRDVYLVYGPVALIRSQNVHNDGFREEGLVYIDQAQADKLPNVEVHENDVLLNITGDSVARCCMAPAAYLPARVNQHVAIIRSDPDKLNPRFLRYFLVSESQQNRMLALASSGATRDALTKEMIQDFLVPTPPIREQDAAASFLTNIENRIKNLHDANSSLDAIARAIFKAWFVDLDPVRAKAERRAPEGMDSDTAALFPSILQESEIGSTPRGWQVGSILSISNLLSGGTPKTERSEYWDGDIPWASAKDVSQCRDIFLVQTERTITEKGLAESSTKLIPAYSTVIVARGATTGRMTILGKVMAMNQTCYALTSIHDTPFALHCMIRNMVSQLLQAAHGSVFETITTSTFSGTRVLLPPPSLLKAYENTAGPLFQKILANTEMSITLASLRDTLLPHLISGKLRVSEVEKTVREVL